MNNLLSSEKTPHRRTRARAFDTIRRYTDLAATQEVAFADYTLDVAGRLIDLTSSHASPQKRFP